MIAALLDWLTSTYSAPMVGVYDGLGSVWPLSPHHEHPRVFVPPHVTLRLRPSERVTFVAATFADGRLEARRIRRMR